MSPAKGYTDADAVALYLGVTLTPAQEAAAEALLPAVEDAIDAYTGHTWLTGPITGEQILPARPTSYLRAVPVLSIEAVHARWPFDGGGRLLTAGQDYELVDAVTGRLLCQQWCIGYYGVSYGAWGWPGWCIPHGVSDPWLLVDYTPSPALPAAGHQAATQILADGLGPQLMGVTDAVESYSITGQLTVKLRAGGADGSAFPASARALLDTLRDAPIVIA